MKILYITAKAPWSSKETFILPEILEMVRQGHQITVIPLRPGKRDYISGSEAGQVAEYSIYLPLFSFIVLGMALTAAVLRPVRVMAALLCLLRGWRAPKKLIKNLIVFPKILAISRLVEKIKPDHIHAHWASTPSTAACIVAFICGLPWSFTAHRWDIRENNMLQEKIKRARFVRAIDRQGQAELRQVAGFDLADKCKMIHMGVNVRQVINANNNSLMKSKSGRFVFSCPAYMVKKKGHFYLLEALFLLKKRGRLFSLWLFGDGPLEGELRKKVLQLGLGGIVEFKGRWTHDALLGLYANREIDAVVLPSIETESGDKEGIPVSLLEAMAWGIPVISTRTGGISELLQGEAGILVPQRNPQALMEAMDTLMEDEGLFLKTGKRGRRRVIVEYGVEKVVRDLLGLMATE